MTSEISEGAPGAAPDHIDAGPISIVHALTPKKPKRRGTTVMLTAVGVAALAALGGWYYMQHRANPDGERPWILPPGLASMSEALICQRDGDIPCAEADLVAYTKKYPTDAHAFGMLAIILTQDGRHKEALYYYQQAEKLGVGTYDLDAGYAKSLDVTGHLDEAIVKNQAALNLYPTLVDVRGALADELVRKGRGKEALDLLESFDRQLEAEGQPAYFDAQVRQIKTNLGGDYAKEAAAETAEDAGVVPKAAPGQILVKGRPEGGALVVPVSIDGEPERDFVVDSGASTIVIPSDHAGSLFRDHLIKPADFRGLGRFQIANGTIVIAQIYNLRSVSVGGYTVNNVPVGIYNGHGSSLLGQTFLRRFKSWSIDNGRRELVLTN